MPDEKGHQARRVQVALHGADAAGAVVPALRERLFGIGVAAVAVLRQFGGARGELVQGAASVCNCAFQVIYQHPRGTQAHALAKALPPALVRNLLGTNIVAHRHNLVDEPAVQALAMGDKLAFVVGKPSPGCMVTAAVLPAEAACTVLFDAPSLVIVFRVVGTALPIQMPFQPSLLTGIRFQFLA